MRLQLIVVGALLAAASPGARAQSSEDEPSLSGSVGIYADSDHMTVVSPRAGGRQTLSEAWSLEVQVAADVITGASVDVVSEASPTAIRELRVEGGAGAAYRVTPMVTTRARGRVSNEHDYRAIGGELGLALDLRQRTTTLDLAITGGRDRVEAITRQEFAASRTELRVIGTWTQVVDRRTYVDLIVEAHRRAGYLANPYRTVPLLDPATPRITRVDEAVPDRRQALAGAVVARRALGGSTFLHGSYRIYRDDWRVSSHTVRAMWAGQAGVWRFGADARGYLQSAADFYRASYQLEDGLAPVHRTRERRLGAMASGSVGAIGERQLSSGLRVIAAASLVRFYWLDFAGQAQRDAVMLTLGVNHAL